MTKEEMIRKLEELVDENIQEARFYENNESQQSYYIGRAQLCRELIIELKEGK